MEPYAANLKTQKKNPRKRPLNRNKGAQNIEPQQNENVPENGQNIARKTKITYSDETPAEKLENSLKTVSEIIQALKNVKISDDNHEVNIDISSLDTVVDDLLAVKASLNQPVIKEVYMHPPEIVPNDKENIDFTSNPAGPSINATNNLPEQDMMNYELQEVNRDGIKPRVALGYLSVSRNRRDNTVSFRAPIQEAMPISDVFYQPVPKQSRYEGIYCLPTVNQQEI